MKFFYFQIEILLLLKVFSDPDVDPVTFEELNTIFNDNLVNNGDPLTY
jgi:hypothetical protein